MKLLYTVILLVEIIQLFSIKPLEGASVIGKLSPQYELVNVYNKEFNLVSRDTCGKLKKISENILKDRTIQQADKPLLLQFKRNITRFLEIYPDYVRYGLYQNLIVTFSDMIIYDYYKMHIKSSKDYGYIVKLMKKLGYEKICDEYKEKILKFFLSKLFPDFEKYKKNIPNNELNKLTKWLNAIEKCKDCICLLRHFNTLDKIILSPKEQLYLYIETQMHGLYMEYTKNATAIVKAVLKSRKLSGLRPDVRQKLTENLKEYIRAYESNHDVNQLNNVIILLSKFAAIPKIPSEQLQLVMEIMNEHGFAKLELNSELQFNHFVEKDLLRQMEHFRNSLKHEELKKERALLDWIKNFKKLTTFDERAWALVQLGVIQF